MRTSSPLLCALLGITVSAAFIHAPPAGAASLAGFSSAAPEGFEQLTAERDVVLDAYFGGKKIGEVRASIRPGSVTFDDPQALAGLIPEAASPPKLAAALSGPLPANGSLACGPVRDEECGSLEPQLAGIILDEDRFRVEVFVHPSLLARPQAAADAFLAEPPRQPALVSHFGATIAGSDRSRTSWHLQNRSIASFGSYRLRSDSAVAEGTDVAFDNLTVEADRRNWRFAGGLFWAPGTELIGRRRIVGLGAATQLDTRQDRMEILGTPLELDLQRPARVDVLIDGRTISSQVYPAGSRLIDTTALPSGSYELVLRIQEDGRPARTEQRFFSKGTALPPLGRPSLSAFVGMLSSPGRGLSFDGKTIFYEASAAYRVRPGLGLSAAILGTQDKAIVEAGTVYFHRLAQIGMGALFSSAGDYGASLRATSAGHGPLSVSFDLRKISSRDGRPLLPLSAASGTFSDEGRLGYGDRGSFAQALSIVTYRTDRATFRLTGLYRKNRGEDANYSLGAAVEIPVVRSARWDLVMVADARKSERETASFLGLRFLANRGPVAASGYAALLHQTGRDARRNQMVGEAQASWYRQIEDRNQLSVDGAVGRNAEGAYSRANVSMRSQMLNARADVLHQFSGRDSTQFAATLDTGLAVTSGGLGIGGRDLNDSGLILSVVGAGADQRFDVLVDEIVRGTVAGGGRLTLFLQPYAKYDVRIRARDSSLADFDAGSRTVTLYPGNVAALHWNVTPLFILFGRAVAADGQPVANADVSGAHGVGRTDDGGYFQIETNRQDRLRLARRDGPACAIAALPAPAPGAGFVSGGELLCR